MLLRNTTPQAIFRIAYACLALFGLLGMPSLSSHVGEDVLDGMRGALIGATIAFMFLGFRARSRPSDRA